MYVARFSNNIQSDIERGWSGWIGYNYATPAEWASENGFTDEIAEKEGADDISDVSDDDIVFWAEKLANTDLRFDTFHNNWRVCHHEGLSCWKLDADTLEGAISEVHSKRADNNISWSGFGQTTIGTVKIAAEIEAGYLYILECDDAENEDF